MKNLIVTLLILILPLVVYAIMSKNSSDISAIAKEQGMPSLITFTSSMCMDCQKLKGVLKEVQPQYEDRIKFIGINALDKNKKTQNEIKKHHVVLVPTLIFLDENGNETNKIEGFIPKEQLIKEIEEAING